MVYEKKKVRSIKLVLAAIYFFAIISFPISSAFMNVENVKAEVVSDDCYIEEYLEYSQESGCSLSLAFNVEVSAADVTVAFYDKNGELLEEKEVYCSSYYNDSYNDYYTVTSSTFYVYGNVDSYEIIDHNVTYEKYDFLDSFLESWALMSACILIFSILPPFCLILIKILLISCKVYTYGENEIVVYAGFYHKYIKVNGVRVDEYNSIIRFFDIHFSTCLEDGTMLNARITLTKRISLKINDKLCVEDRKK